MYLELLEVLMLNVFVNLASSSCFQRNLSEWCEALFPSLSSLDSGPYRSRKRQNLKMFNRITLGQKLTNEYAFGMRLYVP